MCSVAGDSSDLKVCKPCCFFLWFDANKPLWAFKLLIAQISISFIRSQMQGTVSKQQLRESLSSASPAFTSLPENNLMNVIKVRKLQLQYKGVCLLISLFLEGEKKKRNLNLALGLFFE